MPYFSVVIPLYNKEAYIEDTLKSVLSQTFQDFEVIIVDDGSTDKSLEVVSSIIDKRIKTFTQNNLGASKARNLGIDHAKGDYMALLDADDLWYPNHLEELKKLIETFPGAGLYCNNYEVKRSPNLIVPTIFNFQYVQNQSLIIKDFFEANIISFIPTSSSVAILKSKFINVGRYNTNIKSGQDTDLWIKMGLKYKVAFNPTITMLYNNFNDFSLSQTNSNKNRYDFISSYKEVEAKNKSLKKYLDINRFALAIRSYLNDEDELYNLIKTEIDYSNLNSKQRLALNLPKSLLKILKYFQRFLLNNKIYITAYN